MDTFSMNLIVQINKLKRENERLKSNDLYVQLEAEKEKNRDLRLLIKKIKKGNQAESKALKDEIRSLKKDRTHSKEQAQEDKKTIDYLRQSYQSLLQRYKKEKEASQRKMWDLEDQIDLLKKRLEESDKEIDQRDQVIQKQAAIIKKNHTNSSYPSSHQPNHKKIHNSRLKTGKKPGGQKGHKGHKRPDFEPNRIEVLPTPECVSLNPERYVLLDEPKTRQVVSIHFMVEVTEYVSPVWLDTQTNKKVYTPFPDNCLNEVNYDETVKAFLCLLTNDANVSIRKAQKFLWDISKGRLSVSEGMISNLRTEFAQKSKKEQKEIRERLLTYPFMNIDTTFTRIEGKTGYVGICTNPIATEYVAGEKKGFQLMDQTAAADYLFQVVHDGERTMSKYGGSHQGCLVHINRYLRGIIENEPEKQWAKEMLEFLNELEKNNRQGKVYSEEEIQKLEAKYDSILDLADQEYEGKPKGYVEGYNTKKRLREEKESHLYFLRHPEVPYHNNAAEQKAREFKRKTKTSDGFRSMTGAQSFCVVKSVLTTAHQNGENKYEVTKEILGRTKEKSQLECSLS